MDDNLQIIADVSSSVNNINATLVAVSSSVSNLSSLSGQLSGQFTGSVLVSGSLSFDNILTVAVASEVLVYNTPFTIGAKASPAYDLWCGNIDDVGVWNRPLSSQEVLKLFNGNKTL
jgi:hypothetical protein